MKGRKGRMRKRKRSEKREAEKENWRDRNGWFVLQG